MVIACTNCGQKNRLRAANLAVAVRCGKCKQAIGPVAHPIDADAEIFDEVLREARVPVLVDFWAEWCGPCRAIAPALEDIAGDLKEKLTVAKINIDENPGVPQKYNVRGIPTLIVFKNGEEQERYVGGNISREKLTEMLEKYV